MHADSPSDWRAGAQLMLLPHNFSANEIQGTGVTPSATMKTVAAPELPQDFRFMPIKPTGSNVSHPGALQHVTSAGVEQIIPSKPYGIEETIDEVLNVCTEDLYLDMHERQVDFVSPSTFAPNSAYLPYRRYLVDWMSDVGDQFRLHTSTIHVAVLFLDKIFRSREVPRAQWQLIATACISVAAKYEEAEEHCPPIPDLLHLTKLSSSGHTSLSFREGECEVLRNLGWRLRAVPPLHVIGYFLAKGVVFENDSWQGRALIEKIPRYIKKYSEFFCNLTLQDYAFQQYLPTQLAAAIVMASRVALQIEPRWRPELVRLTGYEQASLESTFLHVWGYYSEQFPGHGARSTSPRSVMHDVMS